MQLDDYVHPDDRGDDPLPLLQAEIDRLDHRIGQQGTRLSKLERDRDVLRRRLEQAQRRGLRNLFRKPATPRQVPPVTEAPDPDAPFADVAVRAMDGPFQELRVAGVLDEFSRHVFGLEVDLLGLPAHGYAAALEEFDPQLLLVESAWSGINNEWLHKIGRFGRPSVELAELVEWCRRAGVPTVFWNKEDPPNIEWFLASASLFDHVFTVDANLVPFYRAEFGHNRVSVLQFSAQPRLHYPTLDPRSHPIGFAGSYYAEKHLQRRRQIEIAVDPAREFGLDIWDRHAGDDARFRWPEHLRKHIRGSLNYLQVLRAHQLYKAFLNVNSVTHSPTMCARRVFELLAAGTPVVSGRADAFDSTFGRGIVQVVNSAEEAAAAFRRLLDDEDEWRHVSERGVAAVNDGHLTADRVRTIGEMVL